jgi:hypothetical protein
MGKALIPVPLDTERDGRALAMQLLEELEAEGADMRCSIDPQYWGEAAAQEIPLLRYLQILRERNCLEADRGFCAVITDFVSCCLGGSVPDSAFYAQFLDGPSPAKGAGHG